jgi:hypothetical protein
MCNAIGILRCACPLCAYGTLRGIASGALWPLGREHASDLALVRTLERELDYITTHGTEEVDECA